MAKPATRMKSIVHSSFMEQLTQRLACARAARSSETALTPASACEAALSYGEPTLAREPAALCADATLTRGAHATLQSTIEEQVIPRLALAYQLPKERGARRNGRLLPTSQEVLQLARLAAQPDLPGSLDIALTLLGAGLSLETILLHLITPAARHLGAEWVDDRRSFTDVTVGLGTLHELVHILSPQHAEDNHGARSRRRGREPRRSALLLPAPGEQHTLGLHVFGELLRHSNWRVQVEVTTPAAELIRCVRTQPIDAVCISISSPDRLPEIATLIDAIKSAALNRTLCVLLGGPVELSEEAGRVGATFWSDARAAVDHLERDSESPPGSG